MSNDIKISRQLAERIANAASDRAYGEAARELRALLAQTEMWNPHPAEAHLASLLIVLGSAGIKVSGGTHGDPWTIAAPVVEHQPVAVVMATGGPHDREDRVLCELQAELPPVGTKLYAEQPAPVAVDEKQALQDRHEAWMAGVENGKASVAVVPLLAKGFTTLESIGGKYKIVTGFENRDDAWAAYDELCRATIGIDKVKELIPTTAAASNNLRNFANAMIDIALEGADADGGHIQDLAIKHGLLKPEQRSERCGDACSCAEYVDFPVECFRKIKELNQSRVS